METGVYRRVGMRENTESLCGRAETKVIEVAKQMPKVVERITTQTTIF